MRASSSKLVLSALLALQGLYCIAQKCQNVDQPDPPGMGPLYESSNGRYMTASGVVRILIVFTEVEYTVPANDPTPPEGLAGWPAHQLPTWANGLCDPEEPVGTAVGMFTRYYQEASSGNLLVLGDYLLAPDNGGIFKVQSNSGSVGPGNAIAAVNLALGTSIVTGHGFTSLDDFDRWTLEGTGHGPGEPKLTPSNESPRLWDHVMFIWRNSAGNNGSGYASGGDPGSLLGYGANTHSNFGAHDRMPLDIMRHEFAHLLYGPNSFHTGGGGWNDPDGHYWIQQSGGWSNLGLYGCSIDSWNAWDRQRMGWMAPGQMHEIPAHDATNTNEENGDLDAAEPADAGIYMLRDFVTSGDALRIKLPFIDPMNEFQEWIWVENHQGRNQNDDPFDRWLYEDDLCVIDLEPGLYMYMQIDKDVREATSAAEVYSGYASYLRPFVASGNHDRDSVSIVDPQGCVGWPPSHEPGWQRTAPNPLTGHTDQNLFPLDKDEDDLLKIADHIGISTEYDGTFHENLFWGGHPRHGFRLNGNANLGVGTNPSSASQMSLVGHNATAGNPKDLRRIYLNGLSIAVLEQLPDGSIKVQVRFDDVDVTNDARWCADEIQLNPVATSSGHSLNITNGKTITLDQGRTPTRRNSPITLPDGTKLFCSPTLMRCPSDTWLNMEANSGLVVDNGSTLRLEAGSRLDVADGAVVRVRKGGTLELMGGSTLNVASGGLVIIEEDVVDENDGRLVYHPDARINLDATTSELEISGQLVIKENATFTTSRQVDPNTTYGRVRFSNTDQPSMNVTAEANTRFVLRSTILARKILYVEQESLYGPEELVEFTLRRGTAVLSNKSRIVPTVSNLCSVNFIAARVTSPTWERNTHRGVRLNGQGILTLEGSTFSNGRYGIYSYNTVLGNTPELNDCLFENCDKGMYNYDKGIIATDSRFIGCDDGLYCEQMTKSSRLEHCTAANNQRYGVYFRGVTKLRVSDPDFKWNDVGLAVHQANAFVECGNVSENRAAGFTVNGGAILMLQTSDGSSHQAVTAIDNPVTISCSLASNCGLKYGYNSLRPEMTGQQNTLSGTFLCQPYALYQEAYRNNWNGTVGTPLTTADYSITACGSPLYFVDPNSEAETACGQAIPPCPDPPCPDWPDEFTYCPTCDEVDTDEYGNVKLNVASAAARSVAENDALAGNEKEAIVGLNQILMNDIPAPSADEMYLLEYDTPS